MTFLQTLIGLHAPLQLEIGLRLLVALTVTSGAALALRRFGAPDDAASAHRVLSVALLGTFAAPIIATTLPALPVPYDLPGSLVRIDNAPHMGSWRLPLANILGASAASASSDAFPGPGPLAWLALAWLSGASILGMRQAVGIARLRWRHRAASLPVPSRVLRLVDEARLGSGITRPVRVAITDAYDVPLTFGSRPAVILLPVDCLAWSDQTIVAALRHELSHVVRRDWYWQVVGLGACTLFWFHPLVWRMAREQRRAAEFAADADVLEGGTRPSTYARALLEVAMGQSSVATHPRTSVGLCPASTLEHRIAALAARRTFARGLPGKPLVLILIAVVVATGVAAPVYSAGCHADALAASETAK